MHEQKNYTRSISIEGIYVNDIEILQKTCMC